MKTFTPDYWRARAEEARANAARMKDPEAKQALNTIAKVYDQLAERAELEIKSTKPPHP
jgi:hypothetical protein